MGQLFNAIIIRIIIITNEGVYNNYNINGLVKKMKRKN